MVEVILIGGFSDGNQMIRSITLPVTDILFVVLPRYRAGAQHTETQYTCKDNGHNE